ncbi:MAG: T9SS type A sorting domain-containing protein, partial [Flavobacteriales bacterium]|nr:T9SS type A sorting domain-containing protein [Flavobacteriales bacterium]
ATYTWSGPDGFSSTQQNPTVTMPGTYSVAVMFANGCRNGAVVMVTRDECEKKCPELITNCPADITVDCAADYSPEALGGMPTFRTTIQTPDNKCAPVKNHGWWDETLSACPFVVRRTFWAVSMDGEVDFCEQLITVVDETGPIIMGIPESDGTVLCRDLAYHHLPTVWAFDECTETAMYATHSSVQHGDESDGSYSVIHTWTATDYCGNTSTANWTLFVNCAPNGGSCQKMNVSASPNPFRNECVIALEAKESGTAVVTITDMQGRIITEAYNGPVHMGETKRITFSPDRVGTGAFLYRVQMNGEQTHGRLMHQP